MELNSLPNDCLLVLLDIFPVKEQTQLRAVCTNWNELVVRLWRSVKSIIIEYHGDDSKYEIGFDNNSKVSGNVGSGLEQFVTSEHFPGVTLLKLNFYADQECAKKSFLSHCLTQWTATLTDLTFLSPPTCSREYQSTIWTQIDLHKSLKSLNLVLNTLFLPTSFESAANMRKCIAWKVPGNFSILTNLEKLMLNNYAVNKINYIIDNKIGALTQLGPSLAHMTLRTFEVKADIQSFISIAPKLTFLREFYLDNMLEFSEPPFLMDLFTSLAQLKQLNIVRFDIHWNQFASLNNHLEYPKLTSVKHFYMQLFDMPTNPRQYVDQFDQHFFTCIPIMFPSLETIYVRMYGPEDQPFVDMIEDKMKQKFASLRMINFKLARIKHFESMF